MRILSSNIFFAIFISVVAVLSSCSTQKQIGKTAKSSILNKAELSAAHVGITVYDVASNKYLYNYQGEKSFIPASNTKLFSFYAGLKYLGDSIIAAKYIIEDTTLIIQATGDPTFLHTDFKDQRLYDLMKQPQFTNIEINTAFESKPLGKGWAWDDYNAAYMAERDPFPMYGNLATFIYNGTDLQVIPSTLKTAISGMPEPGKRWSVSRNLGGHWFNIESDKGTLDKQKQMTIAMERGAFAATFLRDTIHKPVLQIDVALPADRVKNFYSVPTDSLFKIMMHRSDNFFAEQTLQMVSSEKLGIMNDVKIIDTLLKTDLKDLPQRPQWVDGSGLSRYNLFSPQDFVWILNKMKNEFGFERIQKILPAANNGTLEGLYKGYEGHIFAKTGTLSNNVALSGYVITKKNRTLIFSVLVNNHQSSATAIRRQIQEFITGIIDKY